MVAILNKRDSMLIERCIVLCQSKKYKTCGTEPCFQTAHNNWDFAQQVFIPHHSQQVGPIYLKTPKKCEVFGVCCEGSGKQVFYLADEGLAPEKGANTVISYVQHYLQTYGLRERTEQFHFDNCCGQNKNNAVLWYGLHVNIRYILMVAGRTKFSSDWHFGLWKSRWRRVDAETVETAVEAGVMPQEVHSPGLDADRHWYLYDNIRQYFRSDTAKDKTCPLPKIAKSCSFKKLKPLEAETDEQMPSDWLIDIGISPPLERNSSSLSWH